MSIEIPVSSNEYTPVKRSKSQKRKLKDVSQSSVLVEDLQSPTKKAKHSSIDPDLCTGTAQSPVATSVSSESTPFFVRTCSLYLPIAPISLQKPLSGLCAEHLSPLLLTYYPPLSGVILSYSNPRLSEALGESSGNRTREEPALALSIAEYGACFVWLTADFLVLAPSAGTQIEGWVNVQSESHLGLVCWNLFNATISIKRLPREWKWSGPSKAGQDTSKRRRKPNDSTTDVNLGIEDGAGHLDVNEQGHWIDGQGQIVAGNFAFNVVTMDAEGGSGQNGNFVSIAGSMLSEADETELAIQEREDRTRRHATKVGIPRKSHDVIMSGASQSSGNAEHTKDVARIPSTGSKQRKHRLSYE